MPRPLIFLLIPRTPRRARKGTATKPFTILAIGIFTIVAFLHLLRIVLGWEVTIQGAVVPMWASYLGLLIAGGLALMLSRETWLPGEEGALDQARYGHLLLEGRSLLDLALRMTEGRNLSFRSEQFVFFSVVMGLFAKSIKTFRAIHLLCSQGLCEDAHALERTLGEILTNIRYLTNSDNREGLARRFLDYTIIQDNKMIEATERNQALRGMLPEKVKQFIRNNLDAAKSRLPEDEFKSLYKAQSWHGESVESIMQSVGLQSLYDLTFRIGSRAVHATDLFDHVDFDPKAGFGLKCLPGDRWAEAVLGSSNLNFLEILNHVNKVSNFGADKVIEEAFKKLRSRHRQT